MSKFSFREKNTNGICNLLVFSAKDPFSRTVNRANISIAVINVVVIIISINIITIIYNNDIIINIIWLLILSDTQVTVLLCLALFDLEISC